MSRWRAHAQLVRLPNVFTALADISLGWLTVTATGTPGDHWPAFALLLVSSACLYSAGMAWNDFFDVEQDRRERPFRPIPSGRISRAAAGRLGTVLLLTGAAAAFLASWQGGSTALVLAAAILLYDGWLKRTWAGPVGMGLCRFLNVVLGLTAAGAWPAPWGWHLAAVVGVYIIGVTWFARTEAGDSRSSQLRAAAAVMLLSLGLALPVPRWFAPEASSPLYVYLLVALGFYVGGPVQQAIRTPRPDRVQKAVKRAIFGLILLDAILATAAAHDLGLVIMLLLLPGLLLGRWLYST